MNGGGIYHKNDPFGSTNYTPNLAIIFHYVHFREYEGYTINLIKAPGIREKSHNLKFYGKVGKVVRNSYNLRIIKLEAKLDLTKTLPRPYQKKIRDGHQKKFYLGMKNKKNMRVLVLYSRIFSKIVSLKLGIESKSQTLKLFTKFSDKSFPRSIPNVSSFEMKLSNDSGNFKIISMFSISIFFSFKNQGNKSKSFNTGWS